MKTPYNNYVLHMLPRILSNLDRDPDSPTYGSFDRNHWHYKIRDFSSAILQQSALALALAYSIEFEGNIYYKNEMIKRYAIAGIMYWAKIQNNDGSFEEYWANEKSIPATGFSLYAICEASEILGFRNETVDEAIRKSARFIGKRTEEGALNQEMASIAGMMFAAKLLNDEKIKKNAQKRFESFLLKQSKEGWYSEYNGTDIGYLTITLDYMIRYFELTKDIRAKDSAKKIIGFISYFIHPDGSLGGEYCTRNTEYFLPYGFEFLKKDESAANSILNKLMENINREYLFASIDERYMLHYVTSSFLKSINIFDRERKTPKLPFETNFEKYFDDAMIFIKSTPKYYFICSLMKGGIYRVIDKKRLAVHTDTGYRLYHGNKIFISEWPIRNNNTISKDSIVVSSYFKKRGFFKMTPLKQTILKFSSKFLGILPVLLSKRMLIYGKDKRDDGMKLIRRIDLTNEKITVTDMINSQDKKVLARRMTGLSMRHTASSRFFQTNSLTNKIPSDSYEILGEKKVKMEMRF
ncbi:MAG: hypothetical protein ABII01_02840 [Candidatus Woesearchaeota archaeon]